jgi:predicted nucleic acid-binding protein
VQSYFDSGVLVKLYVYEPGSEEAAALATEVPSIPFCELHDLEIRNALRAQAGRGVLERGQLDAALGALEEDLASSRLALVSLPWREVFRRGMELSSAHTARLLCRSLDVLHVAAALELGCVRLVTADERQARLARSAGLRVRRLRPAS